MNIAALFGVIVAIVVAVNLMGPVMDIVKTTTEAPGVPSSVASLVGIAPIVFIVVIILGAVAWIGGIGSKSSNKSSSEEKSTNNNKDLFELMQKQSRPWEQYINNLDEYLGIVTENNNVFHPLSLYTKTLSISNDYDWYLADKHPDYPIFKIVGLHKKDESKNVVYVLGQENNKPYLIEVEKECMNNILSKWIQDKTNKIVVTPLIK